MATKFTLSLKHTKHNVDLKGRTIKVGGWKTDACARTHTHIYLLVDSPNGFNNLIWTRQKIGARNSILVTPMAGRNPKYLSHHSGTLAAIWIRRGIAMT